MDSGVQAISAGGVRKPVQRAKSAALTFFGNTCNSYITSTRDVSGLNCDALGRYAPSGVAIETGYIPSRRDISVLCQRLLSK